MIRPILLCVYDQKSDPSVFRQLRPDSTSTTHSSRSLFKLISFVWSGNMQLRVLFIDIFCECWCESVFYIVFKKLPAYCFAVQFVLYCHFCVLSLTGVTLPALLSQWSYVLWRNSSSCLTVKRLAIHHLLYTISLYTGCTHLLQAQKVPKRWPSSFLQLSPNLWLKLSYTLL